MVDMNTLCNLLTVFFLLIFAGYFLAKLDILPVSARGTLTDLVIDFVLPCNIITSFLIEFNMDILRSCVTVLVVSTGIQIMTLSLAGKFYPGYGEQAKTVLRYATVVSNAGFLGNPVAQGLYGDTGLLYASIYLTPVRIVMWSEGVACFSGKRSQNVLQTTLTHPCIVAVIFGMILMIFQVHLPKGIENTLRVVGNCNTALSMILIGNILSDIHIREVFCVTGFWYSFVRLLLIPVLVYSVCKLFNLEKMVTSVSTVLAGMPAPASAAALAAKYHGDAHLAAKIIFLSTALSLATIPILCIMMSIW